MRIKNKKTSGKKRTKINYEDIFNVFAQKIAWTRRTIKSIESKDESRLWAIAERELHRFFVSFFENAKRLTTSRKAYRWVKREFFDIYDKDESRYSVACSVIFSTWYDIHHEYRVNEGLYEKYMSWNKRLGKRRLKKLRENNLDVVLKEGIDEYSSAVDLEDAVVVMTSEPWRSMMFVKNREPYELPTDYDWYYLAYSYLLMGK